LEKAYRWDRVGRVVDICVTKRRGRDWKKGGRGGRKSALETRSWGNRDEIEAAPKVPREHIGHWPRVQ